MEKSPYELNLLHCRQNHNFFMNTRWKGNGKNKENAVKLIVHSITHRGEMWRGRGGAWSKGTVGGGAAPLYQLISGLGEMVWQYIYFPTLIKKGLLLTVIRIQGTAEARRCDAVAVRSQVITWSSTLTLYALYLPRLPPPPFIPAPPLLSQARVLIASGGQISTKHQNTFLWQQ